MDIAHVPRKKTQIKLLYLINLSHRIFKKISNKILGTKKISKILIYPTIDKKETLEDILNRISWYLPIEKTTNNTQITIGIEEKLSNLITNPKKLQEPNTQKRYINTIKHISFVNNPTLNKKINKMDAILIWNTKKIPTLKILTNIHKIHIIDPSYYSHIESTTFQHIFNQTKTDKQKQKIKDISIKNYNNLLNATKKYNTATVFGTGPSLEKAINFNFTNSFNIICNSIVKNRKLLDHIKPQAITFADPVFHFSPSKYSAEFRRQMIQVIQKYNCFCIVPNYTVALMIAHYPELKNQIIGMPVTNKYFNFPTIDKFYVHGTSNILTLFMIPLASSIAKKIQIIGSDGRQKKENYFWKHSAASQFTELMQSAFDTHPSFFRDRIYTDYYEKHCTDLKNIITYGESQKKQYISLTPSYIPALKKRFKKEK